jgi:hypothetical protein
VFNDVKEVHAMEVMFVVLLASAAVILLAMRARGRSASRHQTGYADGSFMFVDSGGSWSSSDCGSSSDGGGGCGGGGE